MDLNRFALIKKNRGPIGMAGKWNGIGGKIEQEYIERRTDGKRINITRPYNFHDVVPDEETSINWIMKMESPHEAMSREFQEETGVFINKEAWHCFQIEDWISGDVIYFMCAFGDAIKLIKTVTDEEIGIFDFMDIEWVIGTDNMILVYNIKYLLRMILDSFNAQMLYKLNPQGVNTHK